MMEIRCLLKKEKDLLPHPYLPLIIKMLPTEYPGQRNACLTTCELYKYPNKSLFIYQFASC